MVCAQRNQAKARANLDNFETYPEVASLYYRISWRKGEPLKPSDLRQDLAKPSAAQPTAVKVSNTTVK